jgi:hypothetical protein
MGGDGGPGGPAPTSHPLNSATPTPKGNQSRCHTAERPAAAALTGPTPGSASSCGAMVVTSWLMSASSSLASARRARTRCAVHLSHPPARPPTTSARRSHHRQTTTQPPPSISRQPAEDHQRPNGPVLTPRSAGHVIPSAVTSPDHQQGHGLELGLTLSRPRECSPTGSYPVPSPACRRTQTRASNDTPSRPGNPISLRSALSGGPFRAENGGWLSADVVSP